MSASALAILGAAAASSAAQMYANSQNIKYAQEANLESVALANTAHQREVRDLMAAGLNPILSAHGSGAQTPMLKTPGIQSPDGGIGSSGTSLARALNGQMRAESQQAQADAASARAYADRSAAMADHQEELLSQEAARGRVSSLNQVIDDGARMEALTGSIPQTVADAIDWSDKKAVKAYNDLVQQYRNQAEQGRYNSSVGRAIFGDVMSGASSAAQIYNQVRGRPGVNKSRTVNNYNMIGGFDR